MARKKGNKQFRDKSGRFAKRGQPSKPPQPRVKGRFASRPAPLRLGMRPTGQRYWIQPRKPVTPRKPTEVRKRRETAAKVDIEALKQTKPTYGYRLEDFEERSNFPEGYSYVTYHLFYKAVYKTRGGSVITMRGVQYNTAEEAIEGAHEEIEEIEEDEELEDQTYLYTIVAVVPESGATILYGSVYPEDYHPKERPGTREYEIAQGRAFLQRFNEGKLGQ